MAPFLALLDLVRVPVSPTKAHAPLSIDPSAVPASALAFQLLEPLRRWDGWRPLLSLPRHARGCEGGEPRQVHGRLIPEFDPALL